MSSVTPNAQEIVLKCAVQMRLVILGEEWRPIEPAYKSAYKAALKFLTKENRAKHDAEVEAASRRKTQPHE